MGDYPDYTDIMVIVGAEIMVPIDLQAAYVMMPVDIQAQLVTLEIDIVAQTVGNIKIDLAAQTVGNILVDIKAQTIGNINIDIETQSVGVYLQPEWAAKTGIDMNFGFISQEVESNVEHEASYTVTAGKKLYITNFNGQLNASGVEDLDKNQMIFAYIYDQTGGGGTCPIGGNGGFSICLSEPVVFDSQHLIKFRAKNVSGHTCLMSLEAIGYEA